MRKPKGFTQYITLAKSFLKDRQNIQSFVNEVVEYAKRKKNLIKDFRTDLHGLLGLLRAWNAGTYTGIPKDKLLLIIAALLYFLSPIDTIPDFLGHIGFTDDGLVILFVLNSIRNEINRYKEWSKKQNNK